MKSVLFAAVLAAMVGVGCGGGGGDNDQMPDAAVDADTANPFVPIMRNCSGWSGDPTPLDCAPACQTEPVMNEGGCQDAHGHDGGTGTCTNTFTWHGHRGCCNLVLEPAQAEIYAAQFFECQ